MKKYLLLLWIFIYHTSQAALPVFPDLCFKRPTVVTEPQFPTWFAPPPAMADPPGVATSTPITLDVTYPAFVSQPQIAETTLYCTTDGTDPSMEQTPCATSVAFLRTTTFKTMAVLTGVDGRRHFSPTLIQHVVFDDQPWGVDREFTIQNDMEFAFIPVRQGSGNAFYMQKTEVTQAQWNRLMPDVPNPSAFSGDNRPVENVHWYQAQTFVQRLNEAEDTTLYRLPTRQEWIYAARAFSDHPWPHGTQAANSCYYGALFMNQNPRINPGTRPVASFLPNTYGVYDTIGNVREWTSDTGHDDFHRTVCGCSYHEKSLKHCKSTHCVPIWPYMVQSNLGFRVVKDL